MLHARLVHALADGTDRGDFVEATVAQDEHKDFHRQRKKRGRRLNSDCVLK